jgi:uncharacterized membrane protein YvlD (DUF360 family)
MLVNDISNQKISSSSILTRQLFKLIEDTFSKARQISFVYHNVIIRLVNMLVNNIINQTILFSNILTRQLFKLIEDTFDNIINHLQLTIMMSKVMTFSKMRQFFSVVYHNVIIRLENMLVNNIINQTVLFSSILTRQLSN